MPRAPPQTEPQVEREVSSDSDQVLDLCEFISQFNPNPTIFQFFLASSISEFTPTATPEMSCCDNVRQHIPKKVQQKMLSGHFINLLLLLNLLKKFRTVLVEQGKSELKMENFVLLKERLGSF